MKKALVVLSLIAVLTLVALVNSGLGLAAPGTLRGSTVDGLSNESSASDASKFAAVGSLTQSSPGAITPAFNRFGSVVGVEIAGETFHGEVTDCQDTIGTVCDLLAGASISVVQNASLSFVNVNPNSGTVRFFGTGSGVFTLEKGTSYLRGEYSAILMGTLTPLFDPFWTLNDDNRSSWHVTEVSGDFIGLEDAFGRIEGQLNGIFPGGEFVELTISGVDP